MRLKGLFFLLPVLSVWATEPDLREAIRVRSESVLLEESTALEQAEAQARTRSEYGLELRPRVTESSVGLALRIYLPDRWNKDNLRNQLAWVTVSEQLRVAALEWDDLMEVYRTFCTYRMLNKQQILFEQELRRLAPRLEEADESVELRQFTASDRAKLYSHALNLQNDLGTVEEALLETRQQLRLILGYDADLDRLAAAAQVGVPARMEIEILLQQALDRRADYRQLGVHVQSIGVAESIARSEDGFRFKFIQPFYNVDYEGGGNSWGLSAAFVLPWGTRNPDIAVFKRQYALSLATMELHRAKIEERLRVLLKTASEYFTQADQRAQRVTPLLEQLALDLEQINTGRLEELREVLAIREQLLDAALQTTESTYKQERIAVDLVEELGSLE